MAKNEEKVEAPKGALEREWESFLAHYKSKNPKKYAEKEARGEFKVISPDFAAAVEDGTWAKNKAKLGIK